LWVRDFRVRDPEQAKHAGDNMLPMAIAKDWRHATQDEKELWIRVQGRVILDQMRVIDPDFKGNQILCKGAASSRMASVVRIDVPSTAGSEAEMELMRAGIKRMDEMCSDDPDERGKVSPTRPQQFGRHVLVFALMVAMSFPQGGRQDVWVIQPYRDDFAVEVRVWFNRGVYAGAVASASPAKVGVPNWEDDDANHENATVS
jgi:hypothetical protein